MINKENYLVLDIGGSAIKYAVMNDDLEMLKKGKTARPKDLEAFAGAIHKLFLEYQEEVKGIAISMPGIIDSENGIARTGGALTYIIDYPIRDTIEGLCKVPVWVGNDAKCAGVAEAAYGALQDVEDGMVIVFGTGIGGCIIEGGEVRHGKNFCCGEFSNICVDPGNAYKGESSWASVNGIKGLLSCVRKYLGAEVEMSGEEIFERANNGDEQVLAALDEFCHHAAVQIFNLQTIFDGERVAIGGGISAQPLFINLIRKKLQLMFECDIPISSVMPDIVPCKYLNDANLLGALYQLKHLLEG